MPNDAKLGLVCGVALVIAVAVVFFRKDGPGLTPASDPAAIVKPMPSSDVGRPETSPAPPLRRPEWQGRTEVPREVEERTASVVREAP